jgi:hypothetical protein
MKNFLYLVAFATLLVSCGKDEEVCTADAFVGTWKGSSVCTLGGNTANETVTVSGSGDKLLLNGAIFSNRSVDRDDCSLTGGTKILGTGDEISGSLSTDKITLTLTYKTVPVGETCTYTLKK